MQTKVTVFNLEGEQIAEFDASVSGDDTKRVIEMPTDGPNCTEENLRFGNAAVIDGWKGMFDVPRIWSVGRVQLTVYEYKSRKEWLMQQASA